MKKMLLVLSLGLNVILAAALFWVNERYGLWAKVQRVWLEEGRVPGLSPRHELNRNYQTRRELFRLDRNKDAKILFIGDSQVSIADWNAMLGAPIVANRGIEGDTSAGVLARLGDEAQFRGDTAVIWIGTNDVLQGEDAEAIAARIIAASQQMAEILKSGNAEKMRTDGMADGGGRIPECRGQRRCKRRCRGFLCGWETATRSFIMSRLNGITAEWTFTDGGTTFCCIGRTRRCRTSSGRFRLRSLAAWLARRERVDGGRCCGESLRVSRWCFLTRSLRQFPKKLFGFIKR